jgi:hypothetical protein
MDNSTPSKRKGTQRDYNMGFKLAVVSCVEKGELTYKQAQRCYGLQPARRTIWSIWHRVLPGCSSRFPLIQVLFPPDLIT